MSADDRNHSTGNTTWWSDISSTSTTTWLTVAVGVLTVLTAAYVRQKETHYLRLDKPHLTSYHQQFAGKTVIITGANTGVGFQAAKQLAGFQAKVVLACRDKKRAEEAATAITASTGNTDITVEIVDISDLQSIKSFAGRVKKCHVLINNAGAVFAEAGSGRHGVDRSFLTNYIGPWYLTRLLLPTILKTSVDDNCEVKIVTVGSRSEGMVPLGKDFAAQGELAVRDLFQGPREFKSMVAYGYSKLANMMFAYELDRRWQAVDAKQWWKSSLVTMGGQLQVEAPSNTSTQPRLVVNLATPGMTNTDLVRNYNSIMLWLSYPLRYVALKPASEGGSEVVYAASQSGVSSKYFGEHKEVQSSETVRSPEIGSILWRLTEDFFAKIN